MIKDRLEKLMNEHNVSKAQLSKGANIPYTTIDGIFKKESGNIKINTLKKLSSYFNCSIDYLIDENVDNKKSLVFSSNEETSSSPLVFDSPEAAVLFLIDNPIMKDYIGYDLDRITKKELLDTTQQIIDYISFVTQKYKNR